MLVAYPRTTSGLQVTPLMQVMCTRCPVDRRDASTRTASGRAEA